MQISYTNLAGPLVWACDAAMSGQAYASPWAQPVHEGYQSVSVARETGEFGETLRQDTYLEYGAFQNWTLSGKFETVWRLNAATLDQRSAGFVRLQREIIHTDQIVVSGIVGALAGERLDDEGCGGFGSEIGASVGHSRELAGASVYAFAEALTGARRDCEHATLDVVVGTQLNDNWTLEVKGFSEQFPGREFIKTELTASRKIGKFALGAGVRREVSGAFDEDSVFMSIFRKF